jgi:hypothetical protein
MQEWQTTSFPNCNMFHELDFSTKSVTNQFEYYTSGGYNDIFYLDEKDKPDDPALAMKILQYGTDYSDRNFDRVRRDGLILERLTKSPYGKRCTFFGITRTSTLLLLTFDLLTLSLFCCQVLNLYGFCGFDVLTPYAEGGTLSSKLRKWGQGKLKLSPMTRLKYAVEAALGLAAVHDIDGEGLSSVTQ